MFSRSISRTDSQLEDPESPLPAGGHDAENRVSAPSTAGGSGMSLKSSQNEIKDNSGAKAVKFHSNSAGSLGARQRRGDRSASYQQEELIRHKIEEVSLLSP